MPSTFDSNPREPQNGKTNPPRTTASPSSTSIEGTGRINEQQLPMPSSSSASSDTNHYITPAEYIFRKSMITPQTAYEPINGGMSRREQFAATKRDRSSGRGMGGGGGSFMSMGCSGRSLLSMDLALRSQDLEGGSIGALLMDDMDDFRDVDDALLLPDFRDVRRDGSLSDFSEFGTNDARTTNASNAECSSAAGPLTSVIEDRRENAPGAAAATKTTTKTMPCPVLKLTAKLERVSTCGSVDLLNENFRVTSRDWGMPVHRPSLGDIPTPILLPHEVTSNRSMDPPPPSSSYIESTPIVAGAAASSTKEKAPKTRREVDMSRSIEPTDDDVLLGRGGFTNTHPGNIRFRDKALELRPWYEASDKEQKFQISKILLESVTEKGSRFLEREEDGLWYEVVGDGARKKASQALRERIKGSRKVTASA